MKNLLFITCLFFSLTFYAQHNYDNQNVIYSQTNNQVTIGSNQLFGTYALGTSVLELNSNSIAAYFAAKTINGSIHIGLSDMYNNGIYVSNNKPFVIHMNGGVDEMMRFQTNGNVSIGTTEAATGFKLSVGGKIMAEEVKVMLRADWPDYVFSSTYNLKALNDVEKFINKNKHLPNIPSAKEVKKNGIEVGEMNAKLLQKIEELTLYVIDLNKQNEKIKKEFLLLKENNNLN